MNIRPWHDETTLPLPLLTGAAHAREFAQTDVFVHYEPQPDRCSACRGDCPTREACGLPIAQATKPPRAAFWAERVLPDVDLSHVFPLERWLRAHPTATVALGAALFTLPLTARLALNLWHYLWSI